MTAPAHPSRLFDAADPLPGLHWIVAEFFNAVHSQGRFLWALPTLVDRSGCVIDDVHCSFPDLDSPDPDDHFTGVRFGVLDDDVSLTDTAARAALQAACTRYLRQRPGDRVRVETLLDSCHWG